MVPGSSKPQEINGPMATDAFRPLSQESRNLGGTRQWNSTRVLKGELVLRYVVLVENAPMIQGRPPIAPRIDGDSSSIIGSTFLLRPRIEFPYRFAISWDLSAMGTGAAAVCSYVEATLPRLDLEGRNHEMASMPRA
jgi:hypothetical protein